MPIGRAAPTVRPLNAGGNLPAGQANALGINASAPTLYGLALLAWQSRGFSANADSTGSATIALPIPQGNELLAVQYLHVASAGAAAPSVGVYLDEASLANELDSTTTPNAGAYGGMTADSGLLVPSGHELLVVYSGATPGAACTLRAQWATLTYVAGPSGGAG